MEDKGQTVKSILITGASGFIGSNLVQAALDRGDLRVCGGIRATSRLDYLQYERLHLLKLDMSREDVLQEQLAAFRQQWGKFDYVVHCAGVTQCRDQEDFRRVNFGQTKNLVEVLRRLDMVPEQFIFLSTLSIYGPLHEADYKPICQTDVPRPNTAYGRSKLEAEHFLEQLDGFPYVILRPTGVYGPRERDYYLLAKSIERHVDVSVGFRRQDITFIYVKDLIQAVFRCMETGVTGRAYNLADGQAYSSRRFSDLLRQELGHPWLVRFTCPLWVLKVVSELSEYVAGLRGKTSTFNRDKYKIMKQRNWRCDITPAVQELGFRPAYDLERGVKETVAWYKKEGWL